MIKVKKKYLVRLAWKAVLLVSLVDKFLIIESSSNSFWMQLTRREIIFCKAHDLPTSTPCSLLLIYLLILFAIWHKKGLRYSSKYRLASFSAFYLLIKGFSKGLCPILSNFIYNSWVIYEEEIGNNSKKEWPYFD